MFLQSTIATSASNLDSRRFRNPSLDNRTESWTEIWGVPDEKPDATEEQVIAEQLRTVYPKLPITLIQFRPAWMEQLVLKIAKLPYVVVNSSYAATESTGSLPYLRDLTENKAPALVGRYHPVKNGPSETNAVLDYLQSAHNICLDGTLSASQKAQSHLLKSLILHELRPLLETFRFEDTDAWEQIYRPQYIDASKGQNYNQGIFSVGSWWQTWSVRAVARKELLAKGWTLQKAQRMARPCYATFETALEQHNPYLLGTKTASTVDCLLFDHLAEALCNVHLVVILADFPRLIQFFQQLYETHFRLEKCDTEEWKLWNRQENLINSFQTLPIEKKKQSSDQPFTNALELMQSLSVHQHDLQEVLTVMKEKRALEARAMPRKAMSTIYRWRMGDDLFEGAKDEGNEAEKQSPQEKWRKDQKYSDEVWISAVVAISLAVIGNAAIKGSQSG